MESNLLSLNILPQYISCAYRHFDENERHITRIFDQDVIIFVYDGILRFSENGKPIELLKNEYYIQRSGLKQEGIVPSSTPKYFYIHFKGSFTDETDCAIPIRGKFDYDRLKKYFDKLNTAELNFSSSAVAKTCLFYNILERINLSSSLKTNEPIAEYITANFTNAIKIKDIAAKLNYSEDYIIRAFYKRHNTTPHKFITSLRMQLAKELLTTTDRTVSRISSDCGYSDISVFYRSFSAFYGCNPLDFREEIKP